MALEVSLVDQPAQPLGLPYQPLQPASGLPEPGELLHVIYTVYAASVYALGVVQLPEALYSPLQG